MREPLIGPLKKIGRLHWLEIPNSLYVTKGHKRLIIPQRWAHNATSANADDNTLDGTHCVTHNDHASLIWGGGQLVCTVTSDKQFFSLYRLRMATLSSLKIVLLLILTHIYTRIRLTVSLKTLLF